VFDIAVGEAEDTVGESKSSKSQGTSGSLRAANRELPSWLVSAVEIARKAPKACWNWHPYAGRGGIGESPLCTDATSCGGENVTAISGSFHPLSAERCITDGHGLHRERNGISDL